MTSISTKPVPKHQTSRRSALEYLLLGDLLESLEEAGSPQNHRWMIAILDMLLAVPTATGQVSQVRGAPRLTAFSARSETLRQERAVLFVKLQRLRDRLAHQAPCALITNEIRCDLRELLGVN